MTRREYSAETKAAVMAALLTGQSVSEVARAYNIPAATVHSWKSRQVNGEGVAELARQKKQRIGELLLEYVTASLEALTAQARVFADETWIKQQSASEVAVLHGVSADKAIRLLEALAGSDEEDPDV